MVVGGDQPECPVDLSRTSLTGDSQEGFKASDVDVSKVWSCVTCVVYRVIAIHRCIAILRPRYRGTYHTSAHVSYRDSNIAIRIVKVLYRYNPSSIQSISFITLASRTGVCG